MLADLAEINYMHSSTVGFDMLNSSAKVISWFFFTKMSLLAIINVPYMHAMEVL